MPFDGIWIDMNEVSNFCNYAGSGQVCYLREHAECRTNVCCLDCDTPERDNAYDFPKFVPHTVMKSLGGRTLPMSAQHAGGVAEYNAHNLHGLMESIATRNALISIRNERPFVLSRSTFPGSGRYTAHWSGDNAATWDDLKVSIITM
jgi:alpha-D-xyloside xylohydrolase